MKKILLAVALLCTVHAHAGASNLYCTITSVSFTDADRGLKKISNGEKRSSNVKQEMFAGADGSYFTIARESGLMLGPFVENKPAFYDTKVVDYGSDRDSFKMSAMSNRGVKRAMYMDVRLWEDGDKKPFVLVTERVFLGWCSYVPIQK